jgi:tetratricopeptide (TPR) repeat protein
MFLEDFSFRLFDAIVHRVGVATCFGLGAMIALIGLIVVARRWMPRVGWSLLGAGAGVAWIGFLAVSECRTEEVLSPIITSRTPTFADTSRTAAQLGLLCVPALAVLVKLTRDKLVTERRRSLLSTYLRMATKAYYSGDFDRAIAEYSIAIKVEPGRLECYVKRGLSWMQKGEYDRAIADFNRVLKIDIAHSAAYLNRGIVLAARGDHLAAIDDYESAFHLSPTDAAPLLRRGLSLAKIGETERAADDFRRVLRLTNHSDFTEPAKFHLTMLEVESAVNEPALAS